MLARSCLVLAVVALIASLVPAAASAKKPKLRCTISGTSHSDTLRGTEKRDVICGKGGDDRITALGGDDYVDAGPGDDRVDGGNGADDLGGYGGKDALDGGNGNDSLYGDGGVDNLKGGDGDDSLEGGGGDDRVDGGSGQNYIGRGPGNDIGAPPQGPPTPNCPSLQSPCYISMHIDVTLPCPSFGYPVGACLGATTEINNPAWASYAVDLPGLFAAFKWIAQGPARRIFYTTNLIPTSSIEGIVPADNSDKFHVFNAWALGWANPKHSFSTADRGGPQDPPAGQPLGPLHLDFRNGRLGADMYISGYLY